MKKITLLLISLLLINQFAEAQLRKSNTREKQKYPKNIILLIGDGMGLEHMYAALIATNNNLNITKCPNVALVKTFSANDFITDSGAAGTAIATGYKTNNGMIGLLSDSTPVPSILKYAEDNGLATGLVATCDITHATPASFVAHVTSRKMNEEIARQFLYTDIDVFIGGGYNSFGKRTDSLNLIDSLLIRHYQVVKTIPEMMEVTEGKMAALLYPVHPPKVTEGRGDMLSLATAKAIDLLDDNKDGFFLMVEGSQIDWGGHDNDLDYIISETIDFDNACGVALEFAANNKETLVIITADHETGGLSLPEGEMTNGKPFGKCSTTDHTATPVPLYSCGPGSDLFHGVIDNTDIFKTIYRLFGFQPLDEPSMK